MPFSRPCTYAFRKSSSLCGLITGIQLKFRQNRIKRDEKQRFAVFLDSFLSRREFSQATVFLELQWMTSRSTSLPLIVIPFIPSGTIRKRDWKIRNSTNVFGRCDLCNGMSIEHDLRCAKFRRKKKHFLTLRKASLNFFNFLNILKFVIKDERIFEVRDQEHLRFAIYFPFCCLSCTNFLFRGVSMCKK